MAGMKLDTKTGGRPGVGDGLRRVVAAALIGLMAPALADELDGLPDPTRPAFGAAGGAEAAGGAARSGLQSTFISASQRRAVIGGRIYQVGDTYGGGTITDIQPYEVVVKQANRETRLRLLPKLAKETYVVKVPAVSREEGNR